MSAPRVSPIGQILIINALVAIAQRAEDGVQRQAARDLLYTVGANFPPPEDDSGWRGLRMSDVEIR